MNALTSIGFKEKTEYYSIYYQIDSSGTQYDCRVSELKLHWPGCQLGVHEVKKATIILDDQDGTVTQHLETENTSGVVVRVLNGDDETTIANLFLTDFDTSVSGRATIYATDKFQELDTNVDVMENYIINDTNLETGPPTVNFDKRFNFFTGNFTAYSASKPGKNGLRCYRIESLGTGSRYIIGIAGTIAATRMPAAPQYIVNPSGATVPTAGFTISQGSDGYWYVQKAGFGDVDYIDINFTLTSNMLTKELFSDVGSAFFPNFNFVIGDALNLLAFNKFHVDPDPLDVPAGDEWKYSRVFFNEKTTGVQMLRRLCGPGTGINYFIKPNRSIKFTAIDVNNITYSSFQQWESSGFEPKGGDSQPRQSVNSLSVSYGDNPDGSTERSELFQNWESRADGGYWISRDLKNITISGHDNSVSVPAGEKPAVASIGKRIAYISESPSKSIIYEIDLDQGINVNPFDCWRFNHVYLKKDYTLYEITRIDHDFMKHRTRIEFKDRSYIDNIDTAQVFRLQGNFPGSQHIFFDDISPGGETYYTSRFFNGTGQEIWTTTYKKFTRGAVIWNGTSDSKSFGTQNLNAAWQIFDNAKWCFFAWVKFPAIGSAEIMFRVQDISDTSNQNFIDIRKQGNDKLAILVTQGGESQIAHDSNTFAASTGTWYHIGFVKNGNDCGWYVDGSQVSHFTNTYTPTGTPFAQPCFFAESVIPFGTPTPAVLFGRYTMPEWVMWLDAKGPFSETVELLPTVGITDTYPVPTGAVTNVKGKFINYEGIS